MTRFRRIWRLHRQRRLSGFVWIGLVAGCLVFCGRGLAGQSGERTKSKGQALSNSAISTVSGESRDERRGPRPVAPHRDAAENAEAAPPTEGEAIFSGGFQPEKLVSPGGLNSTINLMAALTVLSLAPSILIMTTCFIRFIIVTSLLRQALGTQQLPPNQVLFALCLFLTFMVMSPVWQKSYDEGIRPYTHPDPDLPAPTLTETFERTVRPVREFMIGQIELAGNTDTIWMFLEYQHPESLSESGEADALPSRYGEISLPTLMSAYMLSELKVAFIIGFQIFLPFLVIDMVVSTVLMSMGMMMLPPTLVSFPFKLLLFVLVDGWMRTVGMLLASVHGPASG